MLARFFVWQLITAQAKITAPANSSRLLGNWTTLFHSRSSQPKLVTWFLKQDLYIIQRSRNAQPAKNFFLLHFLHCIAAKIHLLPLILWNILTYTKQSTKTTAANNNFTLKLSKFDYHLSCIFNSNAILIFFGALFFPPMGSSASAHLQWWWGSRWSSRSELVILHCCKMKWTCPLHISDLQHVQWLLQGLGVPRPWKCKDWVPVNNSDKIFTKRKQTKLPWWGKVESHHVKFSSTGCHREANFRSKVEV